MITENSRARKIPADQAWRKKAVQADSSNMLLEAGAGTGKTSILVEKVLNIIKSGICPIDEIVAITFTEKAAAEMITRVRDRLIREWKNSEASLQERLRIRQALDNFENHRISTIHGLTRSILLETPFEAGVDPSFSIMEEVDENDMIDEVWEEWIKEKIGLQDSSINLGYQLGLTGLFFKDMFNFIYENRDFFGDYNPDRKEIDVDQWEKKIEKEIESLVQFAESTCKNPEDKGFIEIIRVRDEFRGTANLKPIEKIRSFLDWRIKNKKLGTARNWGGEENKIEKIRRVEQLQSLLSEFKITVSSIIIDNCTIELKELVDLVDEEKRKRRVLTFQDLLVKTRNLLRDNPAARKYYKEKFARVLVDEFQDTDPLQVEIVFYLCEKPDYFMYDWRECPLKESKLFLVGDPKQSIYRFRRADIEIYNKAKTLITGQGETHNITVNFRTVPQIIQWVNKQFSILMEPDKDSSCYQPEYVALQEYRDPADHQTLFLMNPGEDISPKMTASRITCRYETEAVSSFIKEMVTKRRYKIRLKDGSIRPVEYRDIAVLFPKYEYINLYEEAFRDKGIPFLMEGGKLFFERPEIKLILTALRAIDNPRDRASIAAVLKSPLFGLSDEDLLTLRVNEIPLRYNDCSTKDHPAEEPFEILRRLHSMKNQVPVPQLIEQLVELTCIRDFYIAAFPGKRRAANLDKLISLANSFDRETSGTLHAFLRHVETADNEYIQESDAPLAEPTANAVRMMTFHRAKGLEFPVVVLGLLAAPLRESPLNFLINRETRRFEARKSNPHVSSNNKIEGDLIHTGGYLELAEAEKQKIKAEMARLLYVACTRARDILILPAFMNRDKKDPDKIKLSSFHIMLKETLFEASAPLLKHFEIIKCDRERLNYGKIKRAEIDPDSKGQPSTTVFTDDFESWKKLREQDIARGQKSISWASWTAQKEEEEKTTPQGEELEKRIGRAYHNVMAKIDLTGKQPVESLINMECAIEGVEDHARQVNQLITGTLNSGVINRAIKSQSYFREFPFSAMIDGKYYRGAIDLLFVEDDQFVIVDYKTDRVSPDKIESKLEKYRPQATIYKNGIETVTGKKVKEILYYFARSGKAFKMEVGGCTVANKQK